MGKGDRKTRRGKIYRGSHGNARPHAPPSPASDASARKASAKRTAHRTATRKKAT